MNFTTHINSHSIKDSWVTIGSFDGVHVGHQALIKNLVQSAHEHGSPAVVITFWPHPAVFFERAPRSYSLTTPEERSTLIQSLGVDHVLILPFDQSLADLSARQFIQQLKDQLDLNTLLIGPNFALGKGREGNIERLTQLGAEMDFQVSIIKPVTIENGLISSSQIRANLKEAKVWQACQKLGRPYSLTGTVVHGEHRGSGLGFPTANLEYLPDRLIPAIGVYATRAIVNGRTYESVTNIGVRPTFENPLPVPRVEPHLLEMQEQLYQQTIKLEFIEFLRAEQKFASSELLVTQIQQDISQARAILTDRIGCSD